MKQGNLFQDHETRVHSNGYDRSYVSAGTKLREGQLLFARFSDRFGYFKNGSVVNVYGNKILYFDDYKKSHVNLYWPREKDLEIEKMYKKAKEKWDDKQYEDLNNREKSILVDNANISDLVLMDHINQLEKKKSKYSEEIFKLTDRRGELENYISSMLPTDKRYCSVFGKVEDYKHKIGEKVLMPDYERLWVGVLTERLGHDSAILESDCHYKLEGGKWKLIKEKKKRRVWSVRFHLESYSMQKIKELTKSGKEVR